MKVYVKHGKVTQNMHGASRNYRYVWDVSAAKPAIYQKDLRRYHSRRIRSQTFQEGDLVLRLIQKRDGIPKLSSPWEGPFVVSKNMYNGSYYLVDIRKKADTRTCMEDTPSPWNIAQLRPYYTLVEQEHYFTLQRSHWLSPY